MKVAVVQMDSGLDKVKNNSKALGFVARAIQKQAEFILLPEVFNYRGPIDQRSRLDSVAENIPGESTLPLMALARDRKVYVLAGSIYEKSKNSAKVYNTSVLIGPRGRIEAMYRKMHLFESVVDGISINESKIFAPGIKPTMARVGHFNLGMSVCYDVRFPELFRSYARAGAHILSVPSVFTRSTGQAHFETLLRARAIENLCFVLAPNQIGKDGRGVPSYGHSMIIDPWGKILFMASGNKEETIFADLDLGFLRKKRKLLPAVAKM